jgi:cell division transport system permease protein
VQLDTEWVQRLAAILDLLRRGSDRRRGAGAAVIAVVGNTIRLEIHEPARRDRGVQAGRRTDAFVRRPFLYIGFWYGMLGGAVALLLLAAALLLLRGPLERLLQLYGSHFSGFGLSPGTALLVLGAGLASGWAGAWLAVGRHLSAIEPQV